MALDIVQPMRFVVDIKDGIVQRPQRTQLMQGDKNANRIIVALKNGNEDVDLTGATVTGSFISPVEQAKIPLNGSVSGNEASVQLIEQCYAEDGSYQLDVELTVGDVRRTLVSITGYVLRKGSGAVIDIGGVIPSIDDIIAQYAMMQQVTEDAQTAAEEANDAADAANEAAQAADGWGNAEVTAETLLPGSDATADLTTAEDGHKVIEFGIPRGDTGATPQITFGASTGAPGTQVQLEQSGTPEAPVIHLTIPRGDTGAVEGVDYFEGNPSALGEASPGTANGLARGDHVHPMPSAEDTGALPEDGTAADASKLGGEEPAYYTPYENLADNSDFTRWVAQAGIGGTHGTVVYGGDRWKLTSGTITGTSNANEEGYTNVTLNGTLEQVVPNPPDEATAFIELVSGTAEISYADGVITITSSGGVIKNVMLLPGSWQTKPHYASKGYAAELSACQRRFVRLTNRYNNAAWFSIGTAFQTGNARFTIITPRDMPNDARPTLTFHNMSLYDTVGKKGQPVESSEVVYYNSSQNCCYVVIMQDGLSVGAPCVLKADDTAGAYLEISCDL